QQGSEGHREYRTAAGQRATVRLADGSTITLAPGTVVSVAAGAVTVSGEAFFVVAPTPARPFSVRTSTAHVRVLGTAFAVRHYASETSSRVVVEDGRVAVRTIQEAG